MTTDLALASAGELMTLYRRGDASPVEATQAALDRIERYDGVLNAFRLVDAERALADARASEARWRGGTPTGPLDGVPATVKDLVLTRGWSTLRGSQLVDPGQPWDDDAPAVARLREAGAVLIGKTTTPEFGWKGVTDSPLTGTTRNPWNPVMTPGGSSGGAAVAAAMGMGVLHIGTDGGGSIRIPASYSGIFGLKPTAGRVPVWPPSVFGTLSHLGPMTRTVADAARMLNVIARPDRRDGLALPPDGMDYMAGLEDGVAGLRIAVDAVPAGHTVLPEVAARVREAAAVFADAGATVSEAGPGLAGLGQIFLAHWAGGAAHLLAPFGADARARMDRGLIATAEIGQQVALLDYLAAEQARGEFGVRLSLFFADHDLLLMPTTPQTAFPVGRNEPEHPDGGTWQDWTPFTYPFNMGGQPAASVPCGLADTGGPNGGGPDGGLPVGLQIIGPRYADALVLCAARAFERARPFPRPPDPVVD